MHSFLRKQLEPLSLFKKALKLTLTGFFALFLFFLYLLLTPHGARIALSLISDLTAYHIQFSELNGTLFDKLDFKQLSIEGADLSLKADLLQAGWRLTSLLSSEKQLRYLHASGLSVTWHQATTTPSPATWDTLQHRLNTFPVPIKIEKLSLKNATFNSPSHTHFIHTLIAKQAASGDLSDIKEIHYDGSWGKLTADLHDAIKIKWDLTLPNHIFTNYVNGPLKTHGEVSLPNRQFDDPENQIVLHIEGKQSHFLKHDIKDFSVDVKGTLASHRAILKGIYKKTPLHTIIIAGYLEKKWEGNIEQLRIQKHLFENLGRIEINKNAPYALTGLLRTQIDNLKTLTPFLPELANVQGKLSLELQLSGTLLTPQLTGTLLLKEARIRTATLGNKIAVNQLSLHFLKDHQLTIQGQGTWGSGPFTINGEGKWGPLPALSVTFKGDQVLLSNTPEYYIVANPDLKLTLQEGTPFIEGKIFIPHAEIKSLKSPTMIAPSKDVVIISSKKPSMIGSTASFVTGLNSHVELVLGENVTYKGLGFSSKVTGKLRIKQTSQELPTAKGKLNLLNGKYRGYGKIFDISYGQILFSGGPIYNPTLNIRAERKIQSNAPLAAMGSQSITAGIQFSGYLKTPQITFYSTPPMSDADVISYLIVGHPQSKINEAQAELLFQAVSQLTTLMGKSRKDVQFDLAEKLKLDQLGFAKRVSLRPSSSSNPHPLEDTMFVLGKQLSDRLYLHYSVGLLDSANSLGLRYLLGKNITLEASTGTQGTSADVVLSFEGH